MRAVAGEPYPLANREQGRAPLQCAIADTVPGSRSSSLAPLLLAAVAAAANTLYRPGHHNLIGAASKHSINHLEAELGDEREVG